VDHDGGSPLIINGDRPPSHQISGCHQHYYPSEDHRHSGELANGVGHRVDGDDDAIARQSYYYHGVVGTFVIPPLVRAMFHTHVPKKA